MYPPFLSLQLLKLPSQNVYLVSNARGGCCDVPRVSRRRIKQSCRINDSVPIRVRFLVTIFSLLQSDFFFFCLFFLGGTIPLMDKNAYLVRQVKTDVFSLFSPPPPPPPPIIILVYPISLSFFFHLKALREVTASPGSTLLPPTIPQLR